MVEFFMLFLLIPYDWYLPIISVQVNIIDIEIR